jgi:ElaB/YqjD/DUF883 family membrane-anchored ribosome-binding protein
MTPTNHFPALPLPDGKSVGDKIADAASQVKQQINDFGRSAGETIDGTRTAAASGLESTAAALHQSGDKMTGLANATADKLSGTAEYLRNHDIKSMMADVEEVVKKNPGFSLLAAGAIGFLVGQTLRRKD